MSTFVLKLIAIITMLIDHTGAILFPRELMFRIIGRIAFPIFVFLLVEGMQHTSNIKKYLTRLGIFALISEIPFDIAFYQYRYGTNVITELQKGFRDPMVMNEILKNFMANQNVFFTLFLGLLAIYLISLVEAKYKKEIILTNVINAAITIVFCVIAILINSDYSMAGILLIVAFYLFRGNKALLTLSLLIVTASLFRDKNGNLTIQIYDILAMIPITFYKGKKGKGIKYLFYIFYPAHLLILWLISLIS